ncbi:MAG TPA: serine hydrolase domain-containing protein [Thermoanaerobaculia bacterium]
MTASILALVALAAVAPSHAAAGSPPNAKLAAVVDRVVKAEMAKHGTPGMVVAIVDHGQVALQKAYGHRRVLGPPPTENTVFQVAGFSKVATAMGALLLVDQGRLDLDQPAKTYVQGLPPAWRDVTTRQFLTHTSGIPHVGPSTSFDLVLLQAFHDPLRFAPGSDQDYLELNYAVVGKILDAITRRRILDFLIPSLFRPLGMTTTGTELRSIDRSFGYVPIPGGLRTAPRDPIASTYQFPASGLQSTMSDLLKMDAAIRNRQLLKPATWEQMWKPVVPPGKGRPWTYSPGWQTFPVAGAPAFATGGKFSGYRSFYEIVPGRQLSLLLLANLDSGDNTLWTAAAKILHDAYGITQPKGVKGAED